MAFLAARQSAAAAAAGASGGATGAPYDKDGRGSPTARPHTWRSTESLRRPQERHPRPTGL